MGRVPKTFTIVSLGCAKNLVDSEIIVSQLESLGYRVTVNPSEAYLIIVNTCGFLESAVEESIETVLEMARFKSQGTCHSLIVVGCMVQRYGKKLLSLFPEVDLMVGTNYYDQLAWIIEEYFRGPSKRLWISRPRYLPSSDTGRVISTTSGSTYLKIAEGCSNHCSFCVIPRLRGPLRSRSVEDVYREAVQLASSGMREINLIAQDTTAFGHDRKDPYALIRLLERLDEVEGLSWIRILYCYPPHVTEPLLKTIAEGRRMVHYLDIPLQHCVPRILMAMRRYEPGFDAYKLIEMVRDTIPGVTIRTTLMVGFPGESEKDFEKLLRFVEWAQFDHLGAFVFSPELGCRAARFPGQIRENVAKRRLRELLTLQREISASKLKHLVGKTMPVLVEGTHPETPYLAQGRLASQAPEVDGCVFVADGNATCGRIVPVTITDSSHYDLVGVIAESS